VAIRERSCPACDQPVRERAARWCGSCGEPLEPLTAGPSSAPSPSPLWRRVLIGAVTAVVVAGVVLAGGGLVDRAARTTTVDDVAVETPDETTLADLPRGRPPAPRSTAEPTCSVGPRLGCFAWTVESGADPMSGGDVVTGGGHVLAFDPVAGEITAYDLADGTAVWSASALRSLDGWASMRVVDDLVLHHAEQALVARDLASGEERWRNTGLASLGVHEAQRHGGRLLLAGDRGAFATSGRITHAAAAAVVDVVTGELHWQHSGGGAALGPGGAAVILDEGRLRAYDVAGVLRWDVDAGTDDGADSGIWVMGHAISLYTDDGGTRLHRLVDGEALPFIARPMAVDADHTLVVEVEPDGASGGYTPGDDWILLDEAGEVWRTPAVGEGLCFGSARFEAATITVTGCDGGTVVLDRTTGEVWSHTPAGDGGGRRLLGSLAGAGPYELHRGAGTDDLVVVDGRTDTEIARLPGETWVVDGGSGWEWEAAGSDGFMVFQSRAWLVALELPGATRGGGGER
jgi:hypothetical protein